MLNNIWLSNEVISNLVIYLFKSNKWGSNWNQERKKNIFWKKFKRQFELNNENILEKVWKSSKDKFQIKKKVKEKDEKKDTQNKEHKRNKIQKGKSERVKKKRKITIQATSDLCNKRTVFPCVSLSLSIHLCVCVRSSVRPDVSQLCSTTKQYLIQSHC